MNDAVPDASAAPSMGHRHVLVFVHQETRHGISVDCVLEVVRAVAVTELPGAPDVIEGIINVRGATVPVVDLRERLTSHSGARSGKDHFILVETSRRRLALRVEEAVDLVRYEEDAFDSLEHTGVDASLVSGVVEMEDGLTVICDVEAFLSETESRHLADALAARGGKE